MLKDYMEAGRILLAFGAVSFMIVGITYSDSFIPSDKIISSLISGFFGALGVYSFNYWTDYNEDHINEPRSIIVSGKKSPKQILVFSIFCETLAILSAFFVSLASFLIVLTIIAISFAYSYRPLAGFRLKDLSIIKSVIVSSLWAMLQLILLFANSSVIPISIIFLLIFLFLQILIGTIIGDIKDLKGDLKFGIRTIPALLGLERMPFFLFILNSLSAIILFLGILIFNLKSYLILLPLVCLWRYYTIWLIQRKKNSMVYIYNYINFSTYIAMAVLAVLGKVMGL